MCRNWVDAMSDNATVVMDGESDEIKVFIAGKLRGRYKNRYECATHFAHALMRIDELEASNARLGDMLRLSMHQTKCRDSRIDRIVSVLLEFTNEDLPDWIRQKIREALSDEVSAD